MQITTKEIKDRAEIEDTFFESCSEKPCGCDKCCDNSGEAHHLGEQEAAGPVATLRDLLLSE